MKKRPAFQFENRLTKTQTIAGWCYLPVHYLVLPLLLSLYTIYAPDAPDEAIVNVIYYAIGVVFILAFMWKYLRDGFDVLLDRLGYCVITILLAFLLDYLLSYIVIIVFTLVESGAVDNVTNPNNDAVMSLADMNYGAIKGIAIFLAPIVEEVLFRGVVFGTLRKRNRILAYALSILLFSVYHVWQYVAATGDFTMLIYAVQYIPISFVLAWCYERTGTIWTPIFFHMLFNALSFYALNFLQELM